MSIISFGFDPEVNFNRLFFDDLNDSRVSKRGRGRRRDCDWTPLIDVREGEKEFTITTELPGLTKEQIDIGINDDVLTIKGETKQSQEHKEGTTHIQERRWGKFERSLSLPNNVKTEDIDAKFEDGVLELKLPKIEPIGKKISIQ